MSVGTSVGTNGRASPDWRSTLPGSGCRKVRAEELDLIKVVDDPEETVKIITKGHAEADFMPPVPGTDAS
jgi:hypothetical protein